MTTGPSKMLIDEVLPTCDATIIEHIVIEAPRDVVYRTARNMDFLSVHSPMLDAAMFVRGLPAMVAARLGDSPTPAPPSTLRLADFFDGTADNDALEGWLGLGEVPGHEIVFGAVGKVWQLDIEWKSVPADAFREFAEPDYAKIVAGYSLRDFGTDRTLLSYEARTVCTDDTARRKFLRYWWLVRHFVHYVMGAALTTVKDLAEDENRLAVDDARLTADPARPASG